MPYSNIGPTLTKVETVSAGESLLRMGRYKAALETFKDALEAQPKDGDPVIKDETIILLLTRACRLNGSIDDAIIWLIQAWTLAISKKDTDDELLSLLKKESELLNYNLEQPQASL
jgi:tetratricopeptide (TPR) repeat protein